MPAANRLVPASLIALALGVLLSRSAAAALTFHVHVDTANFPASVDPYHLEFVLVDGGEPGNNTATLSSFVFAGGSAQAPVFSYSGSGDTSTSLTFSDNDPQFFNTSVAVPFHPGTDLHFDVELTTNENTAPAFPDSFAVYILDSSLNALTTEDSFASSVLYVDIIPSATIDAVTPYQLTSPAGTVTISPVPEPAALTLLAPAGLLLSRRRKTSR